MAPVNLTLSLVSISASLSILGSFAIIYVISRSTDKLNTTLHRLLLGLCIGDLLTSIALAFTKVIIYSEDGQIPMTTNQAACDAQVFLTVLGGTVSPFYNCGLCVYYLYVIKWNYSNTKIAKNVEPFLHVMPWLWGLISAIIVVASKKAVPGSGFCAISGVKLRWALHGGPLLAIFFAICIQMAVICLHVWRLERRIINAGYRSSNAAWAGRRRGGPEASMILGRQTSEQSNVGRGVLRQTVSNSRRTMNRALAYVGAYFCTYFLVYVNAFIFLAEGKRNATITLISYFLYPLQGKVTSQLRGNDDMNGLQALYAAIQCTPISPRRRNRGLVAGGTGENNSRVRSMSGLRGTVNGDPNTRESDENTTQQDSTATGILPICTASNSTDAIEADASLLLFAISSKASTAMPSDLLVSLSGHLYAGSDNVIIDKEALLDLTGGEEELNAEKLDNDHESAGTDRSMVVFGEEEEKSCSMDNSADEEIGKLQY
eukprot:scaffold1197_cov168-Chaetoceros_neogracile.AAC.4